MVSCESPFLNTETPEPVLPVRDQLRVISRVKQASIVALGSTIGLGVVFQRQPNTNTRKALVGHDAAIKIYEDIALTPVSPYHDIMPTDKFVQLGLAPLLPSARASEPAHLRDGAVACKGPVDFHWEHRLLGQNASGTMRSIFGQEKGEHAETDNSR